MLIIDSYTVLKETKSVKCAHPVFQAWGYTDQDLMEWIEHPTNLARASIASNYLKEVYRIVDKIEAHFGMSLPGELVLIPSMGEIDGFARYDHGHHCVMLGIDFPDASLDYLCALTAHELSHVYRDHSPKVWEFLGKPLKQVSRQEYLDAGTAQEHLVSEGLATLNSQAVFPEVALHEHHYYSVDEMQWCLANESKIDQALKRCLNSKDPDPWTFYRSGLIAPGSPAHAHYFWAARKIQHWIKNTPGMNLILAHQLPADEIKWS